ncbi:MAG: excinuclease ABC subunit UvrC [Elusimicrobiota bacterium]|jgi:excinuclease ABC subunit C|nr:excinuclease ABC subunit UvrC [Elusimicrobiota bacterium]
MEITDINLNLLPRKPGVYLMKNASGLIIYIGKAKNINARVHQYFQTGAEASRGWKIPSLVPLIAQIDFVVCASERDALLLEDKLIKKYKPFFNSMLKDAKTYPYVKISLQEDFPRITMTRRPQHDGAAYFGPYPHSFEIKKMLAFLWKKKYLPLRPCKWSFSRQKPLAQKRINSCIYYHTKQCPAPCAGKISYEDYRAIAQRAQMFFSGDYKEFLAELNRAMVAAAKDYKYELAAKYRDFALALEHIKERVKVSEYKENKLTHKIDASVKLKRLSEVLGSDKIIRHIEAFDNSHLAGKHPVGAMVCFEDGEKYKAHYRRFKIQSALPENGADDFMMMREIVGRRLAQVAKLPKANKPDLFLIDGGKVQLDFAMQAIKAAGEDIKVISLAKREEEIFAPGKKDSIKLDKADPAIRLLMEIRDEVHRFAITYNRLLRSKSLLK